MTDRTLEQAALALAEAGYYVHPIRPRDKRPATPNGFKDATRDEQQILHWWDTNPTANIGIACAASGISVLDIDSKSGADPDQILRDRDTHGAPIVVTGLHEQTRGAHVYYKGTLPTGPIPLTGCEIRGVGAYVIAPGSIHPSGVTYTGKLPNTSQLPDLPDWLTQLATTSRNGTAPAAPVEDLIPAGERNHRLTSIAGSMRRRGMDADEIAAALHVTNRKRCQPPLPPDEIDRIAESISRYEPAEAVNGAKSVQVTPDRATAAAALTELLALDTVNLKVTGGHIFGRGSGASADILLSDSTKITFEALRDMGQPTRLMVEVTSCTGATPTLKGADARRALALLRQVADHTEGPSADDLAMDWCRGYLRGAEVIDVDMNDQNDRWGAFNRLEEVDPSPWKEPGATALGTVLRHIDGSRYVRTGWFRNYVKAVHDHTASPQQITARVNRLGWQRAGGRGQVKATRPGGHGVLIWTFYIVPPEWEGGDA